MKVPGIWAKGFVEDYCVGATRLDMSIPHLGRDSKPWFIIIIQLFMIHNIYTGFQ